MKNLNLSNVQESNRLQAGGYVCEIMYVEDVPLGSDPAKPDKGDYLRIEFDIAEGPEQGYFTSMLMSLGWSNGSMIRSYKPRALGMFKQFIKQVEDSNPGFSWNWDGENDEQTLVGCKVGVVLGEEEYRGNDGTIKTRLKADKTTTVDDLRKGKFKVPETKRMAGSPAQVVIDTTSADSISKIDEEVPF